MLLFFINEHHSIVWLTDNVHVSDQLGVSHVVLSVTLSCISLAHLGQLQFQYAKAVSIAGQHERMSFETDKSFRNQGQES